MSWPDELTRETNTLHKQRDEANIQYNALAVSLFPMVKPILVDLGKALWGRRLFVRNFRFLSYEKAGHQTWAIEKGLLAKSIPDCVSVMLAKDMKQFYVCCKDLVDHRNCSLEESQSISEQALTETLHKACKKRKWYLQN